MGGGLGASVNANTATARTDHTTTAAITGRREFRASGKVEVTAEDGDTDAHAQVSGLSAALGLTVGVSVADADADSRVCAYIGSKDGSAAVSGLILEAGELAVNAIQTTVTATADSSSSSGALYANAGVDIADADTNTTVLAKVNAQSVTGCADGMAISALLKAAEATTRLTRRGVSGLANATELNTTATAGGTVNAQLTGTALAITGRWACRSATCI